MKPKISIIVATYNADKTLPVALDSIFKQSFHDWECIVIDGDSNDSTISIIKGYESLDSRFRHISEPDNGIYDAFNKGWKLAKGDWVYYLGADDKILPTALEKIPFEEISVDIFYGDIIFHNNRGYIHARSLPLSKLKGNMVSHQCLFMKKSLIKSLDGFNTDYKICADFELFQRALLNNKVMYMPIEIAIFEAGGASSVGGVFLKERFVLHKKYGSLLLAINDIVKEFMKVCVRILLDKIQYVK